MKIKIEFDGIVAKCLITSATEEKEEFVPFMRADQISQVVALGAFHAIEKHWKRDQKEKIEAAKKGRNKNT